LDEIDLESFKKHIASNKSVTKDEIDSVLQICQERKLLPTLTCMFYLMRCANNAFREMDLINFMLDRLVLYVLQKKEYKDVKSVVEFRPLYKRARETFIRSVRSGEAGELLLFLLLEVNDIIQLFSKMDLKTSGNMPVHGCDAIHIQVREGVMFHFGHSKMEASFNDALTDSLADVEKFAQKSLKERELHLVSSRLDEVKFGQFSNDIRALISPYTRRRDAYREVDSIFIGANWPFMTSVDKSNDDYVRSEYEKLTQATAASVGEKVSSQDKINTRTLLFLILPFQDEADFRVKFQKELNAVE
jgi:hypothetical protein